MDGIFSKLWSDPSAAARLAGVGQVLGALDQGQVADVSPFLSAIHGQQQQSKMQAAMQDPDLLSRFSAEERKFIASLPVEAAQGMIAERLFAKPEAVNLQTFNGPDGTVYQFNPRTGETRPLTGAKVEGGARPLTDPQERAAWGIPEADTRPYAIEAGKPPQLVGDSKGVTVNNNMGGDKFDEAWAKNDADMIGSINEAGMAAIRNQPRIDQLDALLTSNPTGGVANLQVLAGEWGINTSGLDELQTAQAIINSMVPEQRQPGSGPMSDADLALFKQSLPRIITQPGGNRLIVDTMRAIAEYDAEGARIIQAGREGRMSRAQMFDALQKRENPLAGFVKPSADRQQQAVDDWTDIGGVKIRRKGN